MSQKSKIIVIDANILIRAVLGIRTFSLIAEHSDQTQLGVTVGGVGSRSNNRINKFSRLVLIRSTQPTKAIALNNHIN